jgi:hypothetical protein
MTMPEMQHVQATQPRVRRRGWGPPLVVAALAAVLSLALAGPALAAEPPSIFGMEPKAGPVAGGTSVAINGAHFTGATAVKFGSNNAASFTVNSETSITAVSPPGTAGSVDVTVTTPAGTSSTSGNPNVRFTYGPPTVFELRPDFGAHAGGTSVKISGTGFNSVTEVKFGATSVSFQTECINGNCESSIITHSPPGTGTVDVTVTTPGGTSATSSADQFFYEAPFPLHYKKDGVVLPEGAPGKTFVQGWGTLKRQTTLGGVAAYTCRYAEGGYVENPVGGGAGVGAIELLSGYQCTFTACPNFPSVLAEELPWPEVLEESYGGFIRARTVGTKQDFQCWATKAAFEKAARGEGQLPNAKNVFIGAQTPAVEHGTSAAHPGFLEFGIGAGKLEQEGSAGTIQAETQGKVKVLGYKEQELIEVE